MGRYYKQAKPQAIDYAFRFPTALLERAVAKKDAQIDQTVDQAAKLDNYLAQQKANKANIGSYLDGDVENYNRDMGEFQNEIDNISQSITDDPFNSQKQRGTITKLRGKVATSLTSGNLHQYSNNAKFTKTWFADNKKINPIIKNKAYEQAFDKWKAAGGSIDANGNYNNISNFLPTTLYDANVKASALKYGVLPGLPTNIDSKSTIIADNLFDDAETRETVKQNLRLGLLVDKDNEVIDATDFTPEQEHKAVMDELNKQAYNASILTRRPVTGKGKGTIPKVLKGEQQAQGVQIVGKGITVNSTVKDAQKNYPNLSTVDAVVTRIADNESLISDATNPTNRILLGVENTLLNTHLKKHNNMLKVNYLV